MTLERWGDRSISPETGILIERLDRLTDAILQLADVFRRQLALAEQALAEHEGPHRRTEPERMS